MTYFSRKLESLVDIHIDNATALSADSNLLTDCSATARAVCDVFRFEFQCPFTIELQASCSDSLNLCNHPVLMMLGPLVISNEDQSLEPFELQRMLSVNTFLLLRICAKFINRPFPWDDPECGARLLAIEILTIEKISDYRFCHCNGRSSDSH